MADSELIETIDVRVSSVVQANVILSVDREGSFVVSVYKQHEGRIYNRRFRSNDRSRAIAKYYEARENDLIWSIGAYLSDGKAPEQPSERAVEGPRAHSVPCEII